jgi:hypothetical protein
VSWEVVKLPDGQLVELWLVDLLPPPILWSDPAVALKLDSRPDAPPHGGGEQRPDGEAEA